MMGIRSIKNLVDVSISKEMQILVLDAVFPSKKFDKYEEVYYANILCAVNKPHVWRLLVFSDFIEIIIKSGRSIPDRDQFLEVERPSKRAGR
jgi:hypothetical protein